MIIMFTVIGFLCGCFMFSYWLGLAVKKDLREIGDGNPGAFNLWHVAGYKLGILGISLDFMKGYLPLLLFLNYGLIKGLLIVPVAISPILGQVFSPFMKFKGGKAIAVTFGVWSALTSFEVSIAYAIILAILLFGAKLLKVKKEVATDLDGFMIVLGMSLLGLYLMARAFPLYLIILWLLNLILLSYTNRNKLYKLLKRTSL